MAERAFRFRGKLRVQHRALAHRLAWVSLAGGIVPPLLTLMLVATLGNVNVEAQWAGWVLGMAWLAGWLVVSPLAFIGSFLAGRTWSRGGACVVDVSAAGIVADEGRRGSWSRDAIESAIVLEKAGFAALEIVPEHGASVVFETSSDGDARAALDALDLGVRNERVRIPFGARPAVALLAAFSAAIGAAIAVTIPLALIDAPGIVIWLAAFVPTLVPALVYHFVAGGSVLAGSDGVRVVKPFKTTFVPASAISNVSAREGIRIERIDGTSIHVGNVDGAHIVAFIDHVDRLVGRHEPSAVLLDRGARSIPEWRAALANIATSGGYRDASLGIDALVEVATNPGPIDRRLAAAIALAKSDDATRTRVRVAASALAGERARIAMEDAIDGDVDDDAIERALEEAEPKK